MAIKKKTVKSIKTSKITKNPLKKTGVIRKTSNPIKTCLSCSCLAKVKKPILIFALLIILGLAAALYFLKNQFVVAIVNGKPIWRFTLIKELEKQGGKQVLDTLVTRILILEEAKNQNLEVTTEEINQGVKDLEQNLSQQGQELNQFLKLKKMTKDELMEEIKIQKIVEKLAGKDIEVDDKELNEYIEKNKDSFPKDTKVEEVKEDIRQQLKQQKMSQKLPSWIQSLHDKAKIKYLLGL